MAEAKIGVLTAVDVSSMGNANGTNNTPFLHPQQGSTWALVWWLVAVVLLFIL